MTPPTDRSRHQLAAALHDVFADYVDDAGVGPATEAWWDEQADQVVRGYEAIQTLDAIVRNEPRPAPPRGTVPGVVDHLRRALADYDRAPAPEMFPTGRAAAANTLASYVRDLLDEVDGARPKSAGEQLDEITRELDATGKAWVAAGYPRSGPEFEAREAAFARLHQWNEARA